MDYILSTDQISKQYDSFTLDNISVNIPRGTILGLIGENGSGKTTLLSLILGQIKYDSGVIRMFGKTNINNIQYKKDIGFVVDECCFHSLLNGIEINKIMKSIYEKWDEELFFNLLTSLGIDKAKKIGDYSKGMKNKLMLSTALAHEAKFLVLDEITSGLDPVIRNEILYTLQNYVKKNNATVLFSTHITSDIEKIADQVAFLHRGKLVFQKNLSELNKQYSIARCDSDEWSKLNKNNVIKVINQSESHLILFDKEISDKIKPSKSWFNLDDLMLLLIKGGNI
ncbi:MAG: type transport system ATP-binding protein [Eubacteriaceae bacterium]|nr:type transport system ATP-binding protein [Eubacteriaceae bacterium]